MDLRLAWKGPKKRVASIAPLGRFGLHVSGGTARSVRSSPSGLRRPTVLQSRLPGRPQSQKGRGFSIFREALAGEVWREAPGVD